MTDDVVAYGLKKSYSMRGQDIPILADASLTLRAGEVTTLVGASGSGKTTLLGVLGLLLPPDDGKLCVFGRDVTRLSSAEAADVRAAWIGFVFQSFNLLPQLSAEKNVALPFCGSRPRAAAATGRLLERVGMSHRAGHRPSELSQGEQQRVAIARALVNDPPIILADEPTGNLDRENEQHVLGMFREIADDGKIVLIVTHSTAVTNSANRVVEIAHGQLVERSLPDGDEKA